MAINTSSIVGKLVKFISVKDSAIDWEKSLCTQEEYEVERDLLKLVFKEDDKPTVLVFLNPCAVQNRKNVMDASAKGYQREEFMSIFHNVFQALFVGMADSLVNDHAPCGCSPSLMQALDEQDIILEAGKLLIEKSTTKK